MSAAPAQPVLASTLFALAKASNPAAWRTPDDGPPPEQSRTRTGFASIDSLVLDGGFESKTATRPGLVAGVAVERSDSSDFASLLLHKTLATRLAERAAAANDQKPDTFVVDPSGAFDPRLLLRLLVAQLTPAPHSAPADAETRARATRAMGATSVLRVMDFEGLMDALAEVDRTLRLEPNATSQKATVAAPAPGKEEKAKSSPGPRDIVPDSDDEGSDAALSPPSSPPQPTTVPSASPLQPQPPPPPDTAAATAVADTTAGARTTTTDAPSAVPAKPLVLIPSAHAMLTPLLRAPSARGPALLAHLQRRLRGLARAHAATVLLFNVTVGSPSPATPPTSVPTSAFGALGDVRPALGRGYAAALDLSVLAAGWREDGVGRRGRWSVEVLHDRCGRRLGDWVVVDVVGDDARRALR